MLYGKQDYKVATAEPSSEVLTMLIVTIYCLLGSNANKSGTVRSESRCALVLWYVYLVVSIEVAAVSLYSLVKQQFLSAILVKCVSV
jgi:hypothetical protein